jgi:hypothetical protein
MGLMPKKKGICMKSYTGKGNKKEVKLKRLWSVVNDDEKTNYSSWKYIDFYERRRNDKLIVVWIKNPHFAYERLSPYDKNDMSLEEYKNGGYDAA